MGRPGQRVVRLKQLERSRPRSCSLGNVRLLLAALAFLGAGCARPGVYWGDRWNDFRDCFTLEAGPGIGYDADLHVTDWIATGVGVAGSAKFGFAGRKPVGLSHGNHVDLHISFPLVQVFLLTGGLTPAEAESEWSDGLPALLHADYCERNAQFLDYRIIHVDSRTTSSILLLNAMAFTKNRGRASEPKLIDAFDADLGATLLLVSARIGFSPGQFADFALGFFGLDIAGDDAE